MAIHGGNDGGGPRDRRRPLRPPSKAPKRAPAPEGASASAPIASTGELPPAANLTPKPGTEKNADRIRHVADLLRTVWTTTTGEAGDMPEGALEIALAHAGAEGTGYGQGWDGAMAGSWNLGSYQGFEPDHVLSLGRSHRHDAAGQRHE